MKKGFFVGLVAILMVFAIIGCDDGSGKNDPTGDKVTIKYNLNGGTGTPPADVEIDKGGSLTAAQLPDTFTRDGYTFDAWYTAADGGTEVTTSYKFEDNATIYAQWIVISGNPNDPPVVPELNTLANASYQVGVTPENLRITVQNPDGGVATYQWYSAATEDGTGTAAGTSRDLTPDTTVAGTTYYWVVVTNTKIGQTATATSNRARIIVVEPTGDSAIERIVSNNSSVPLWEFVLPTGASWDDYPSLSIDYYVSVDSRAAEIGRQIRSRAYGAYVYNDFTVPDQGNLNGWGGFRLINWNGNIRGEDSGVNPNNDFIIDNSRATSQTMEWEAVFGADGGVFSKWFNVIYSLDGSKALNQNTAKFPTSADDAIYVGAGIFQNGGDSGGNYEFYVKNPILVHKDNPELNIAGGRHATGTSEILFAGNMGNAVGGTTREVVQAGTFEDVEGMITITFDLAGGTGTANSVQIQEGNAVGAINWPANPTRDSFTFVGWFVGEEEVDANYVFNDRVTVTAVWQADFDLVPYEVDLTGQTTKNETAWSQGSGGSPYVEWMLFAINDEDFDISIYDNIVVVAKYYDATKAEIFSVPQSNFQFRWFENETNTFNATGTNTWNFGQGATANTDASVGGLVWTVAVPDAVKAYEALWGVGIQTSNQDPGPTAQFIEVLSITFTFNE